MRKRPIRPTVKKALREVELVLLRGDQAAKELWAVLTALRGPDAAGMQGAKRATTIPIRRVAFPRVAAKAITGLGGTFMAARPFDPMINTDDHFAQHIRSAAEALRMIAPTNRR